MANYSFSNYLETEVMSADPLKLVVLLYRGAIEAVRHAQILLSSGDIAGRSARIGKAVDIIHELFRSLDHARGGAVSRQLMDLYDYMIRRLIEANTTQTAAPLVEVESLLSTLAEAWRECASQSLTVPEASYSQTSPRYEICA